MASKLDDQLNDTVHAAPRPLDTLHQETEYQYEELESTQPVWIRLVVILPGSGTDSIQCRIKAVRLDESTGHTAVSYTWATEDGDAAKSRRVYICSDDSLDQRTFIDVTVNCERALQQLRDSHSENSVWIDSVSINQENLEERNAQVSNMDSVYKYAARVDICLNTPGKDFRGAMTTLVHPYQTAQECSEAQERLGTYVPYVNRLENLAELFTLRYFRRVWVIQEVILARSIFLHVDNLTAPFQITTLRQIQAACQSHSITSVQLSLWLELWQPDILPDMLSLVNMTIKSLATDPRDKIFAIIGLLPTHIRSAIPIDYTLSVEHVLAYAINAYIRHCGDLEILRYAQLPNRADKTTASTFSAQDLKRFLGWRTEASTVDEETAHSSVYAVMQPLALIPRNQVLPRLKVLARLLDKCIQPTRQTLYNFKSALSTTRGNSLLLPRTTEWHWLIDTIRHRYISSTPDAAILSAIETELEHACERKSAHYRQDAFRAENSVGFSRARAAAGDAIFEIVGAPFPFLLREVGPQTYRIVGECYVWADVEVGYWHPSQLPSGLSYRQPDPAERITWTMQVIEVY